MRKTRRNRPVVLLLPLLFLLLAGSVSSSWAESGLIGKVIAIRGGATLTSAAGSRTLALGEGIAIADLIRTGKRCRLQIMFKDNTIVSLGPDSEFSVKDYAWDASKKQGKMASQVNEGLFRVLGGSITKSSPESFTTETPSATIGIRGSMYAGQVRDGQLSVVFQGGTGIFVKNDLGHVEIATPGFGTRVSSSSKPPAEPFKFSPADLQPLEPLNRPQASERETRESKPEDKASRADSARPAVAPLRSEPQPEPVAREPIADQSNSSLPVDDPAQTTSRDQIEETQLAPLTDPVPTDPTPTDPVPTDPVPTNPTPTPPASTAVVSGQFLALQDDLDLLNNIADQISLGVVAGNTTDGKLNVQASTGNGTYIIDEMTIPVYDPSLTYNGYTQQAGQMRNVDLLGSPTQFSTAEYMTDTTGEFTVFQLKDYFNGGAYRYAELGFAGTPTLSLPSTGTDKYTGPLLGYLDNVNTAEFESFGQSIEFCVNWHSGKIFGVVTTPGPSPGAPGDAPGFFFGDISGTGVSNVQFVGMDIVGLDTGSTPSFEPLTIEGYEEFAQFYGNQAQGFGFVARGNTFGVQSQLISEDWEVIGGAFREPSLSGTSQAGTVTWQGFTVGVAENMANPDVNRRLFMNLTPSDFSLTINRDTGSISGSLSATDQAGSTAAITGLTVGGGYGSAYVDETLIAAGLGGSGVMSLGTLRPHGNYLVSEDPANPLASYANWGSWELAFEESGPVDYHLHVPGAMWIAGERTPATEVQGLISTNFAATYTGGAEGVMVPAIGSFTELHNGSANLMIDFSAGASVPVYGSFDFDEVSLPVYTNPGDLNSSGFSGAISPAVQSSVQGAFFGPNAASVAGSFDALMSTGEHYLGIFGGDR